MGEQRTFAGIAWSQKGKVTRREQFLAEMDAVIPWARLLALIEPYYPKAGRGRQPPGLEKMLRIYFLQQWFNLSDPQAEDAIYDSEAMRRFARVELGDDVVPDETTILRFRHLLEQHRLTAAIFEAVEELLTAKRLLLQSGTIVDAMTGQSLPGPPPAAVATSEVRPVSPETRAAPSGGLHRAGAARCPARRGECSPRGGLRPRRRRAGPARASRPLGPARPGTTGASAPFRPVTIRGTGLSVWAPWREGDALDRQRSIAGACVEITSRHAETQERCGSRARRRADDQLGVSWIPARDPGQRRQYASVVRLAHHSARAEHEADACHPGVANTLAGRTHAGDEWPQSAPTSTCRMGVTVTPRRCREEPTARRQGRPGGRWRGCRTPKDQALPAASAARGAFFLYAGGRRKFAV
jgi:IS5 family transposase